MPAILIIVLLMMSPSLLAQASDSKFQSNWSPNSYRIVCDPPGECNLSDATRTMVESLVQQAVSDIAAKPFKASRWWAYKKADSETGAEYMELYESGVDNEAYVSCQSLGANAPIAQAIMNLGNRFDYFRENNAEYWMYNFVAHEVFHLSQYEYPFWDSSTCGANVPGWVMESTATAYGIHMMRKRHPSSWPPERNRGENADLLGLRRYDISLPQVIQGTKGEIKSGKPVYQRISSFWSHVAEAHHNGSFNFLDEYMKLPAVGKQWVSWLEHNSQTVTGTSLGMVFGGFLGDFAGWGDRGMPGEITGRTDWLKGAFYGCEKISLSKSEPVDYIDLDLEPIAGECIEVSIDAMGSDGVAEGESAAVQIAGMIMTGAPSARGGLHLALAATTDMSRFHCARAVEEQRKNGVGRCLLTPDDGKIKLAGGKVDARVWNVIPQEKDDDPPEVTQMADSGSRKGEINNLYTVSYTPTPISRRDQRYDSSKPISVRLYFILDVAEFEMYGPQKGAVGSFASGSDPQSTLPKVNSAGSRVNSYAKPDQFQPSLAMPATPAIPNVLAHFSVGTTAANADSHDTGLQIMPIELDSKGKLKPRYLSVGESGGFSIHMMGNLDGTPAAAQKPGNLQVEEFTDLVFRARFSGTVCRFSDVETDKAIAKTKPCRDPVPVSGALVKAFAGSRLPGNYMVVERTEGTEMYRKAAEQGMAEWYTSSEDDSEPNGSGVTTPPSSGGRSSGGSLSDCACTCEEYAETAARGEELKARKQAGEELTMGDIMGLNRCGQQCQSQYVMCAMEDNKAREEEEAAQQASRQTELEQSCDCSCDALNSAQQKMQGLVMGMASGDQAAMKEMEQLGSCMGVCQQAMMQCMQSR